jgi:Cu+-exporting ATPase
MHNCSHCGDTCKSEKISFDDHYFCCNGCKTVFQLLNENDLCDYYNDDSLPGIRISDVYTEKFNILDEIENKFILFRNEDVTKAKFTLPQIHCSSCIWLLEHLSRLNEHIISSEVNFQQKTILISFNNQISLKDLAILLSTIGYEPRLDESLDTKKKDSKSLIYKIGVAGFCFGNIMLFSFPEYFGLSEKNFSLFFSWLSFFLSIPIVLYSGIDYLKNAFLGLRQKQINMDIPITLGIITLFVRSTIEIATQTGSGYFDSLSGLVFFLLVGKWFQAKTYDSLSFERTYKSYFPLSVSVVTPEGNITTKLENLKIGDEIIIRNQEIIPADAILQKGKGVVDYSFVTGESDLIEVEPNSKLYAGGRHKGQEISVILTHKPDNSYLTQLWNKSTNESTEKSVSKIADDVSHYFTLIVLGITALTFSYWFFVDYNIVWNAVSAVLIVACPCALALTIPFTLGNSIRFLGRNGIYLKNATILEKLSKIDNIVFDKTGTLTKAGSKNITYYPITKSENEIRTIIKSIVKHSSHPLSMAIAKSIPEDADLELKDFEEIPGKGLQCTIGSDKVFIGNSKAQNQIKDATLGSKVSIEINGQLVGFYSLKSSIRDGLKSELDTLNKLYSLSLISGDNNREDKEIFTYLNIEDRKYNLSPKDKLDHITALQNRDKKVIMVGDGLNDAGALMQSDVGIAVSDDVNYFVPACDVILNAKNLNSLSKLMHYSKISMQIIWLGFTLSFLYNIVGLTFAVTGSLSPIVAAILMPLSSITIVAFTSLSTRYFYRKIFTFAA